MKNKMKGFTLIELLIVVAIIGILAAIAIPNFLEAQTRAKIARAQSELRTLAIGIETYTVDYNLYPFAGNAVSTPPIAFTMWFSALTQLSTPVAYVTSIPPDVFQKFPQFQPCADHPLAYYTDYPQCDSLSYDYSTALQQDPNDGGWGEAFYAQFGKNAGWRALSLGPSLDAWKSWDMDTLQVIFYDPTNGTTSIGRIVRTPSISSS